ncbi:MAG TPA: PspC domain-containing protein [Clostridiales bacterium]|nr:PspC domain-containing protein [Clostridia bacterium]MDD4679826.1 PspC domain-containing protein [Clostridia bacterium]HCS74978.1 PspC domain-containing protein [Clostridiales bacterium]
MSKKLYRSNKQKVFAGVCGGLAEYLNVDVTIVRLIWVLAFFAWGVGLLAYIIAAVIIPTAVKEANNEGTTVTDEYGNETFVPNEEKGQEVHHDGSGGKNNSLLFIGGAMVVIGILVLLDKYVPFCEIIRSIRGYGWPILLIITGVLILISSLRNKS